jgi:hypothetical protein
MLRRLPLAIAAVAVLLLTAGCTHLGPGNGNDQGAKSSTVVYRVSGTGTADVQYAATGTKKLTNAPGQQLPFAVSVQTTDHSDTVYSVTASKSRGSVTCSIEVNGDTVQKLTSKPGQPVTCSFIK